MRSNNEIKPPLVSACRGVSIVHANVATREAWPCTLACAAASAGTGHRATRGSLFSFLGSRFSCLSFVTIKFLCSRTRRRSHFRPRRRGRMCLRVCVCVCARPRARIATPSRQEWPFFYSSDCSFYFRGCSAHRSTRLSCNLNISGSLN